MKRAFALILSMAMVAMTAAGCSSNIPKDAASSAAPAASSEAAPASSEAPASSAPAADNTASGDTLKTGLAVITSAGKSADAGEKDGLAQADSTVAAVLVDKDGKIVDCKIDAAQTKINFSKEGKILTDVKSVFKSKIDMGEEYGMKKASSIGKEWSEQANAFAQYAIGKTVADLKGIAVNEEGAATDAELAASVTVSVGGFVNVIEKAVGNAQDRGAKAGDKLGLGVQTTIEKSADVGEKDGVAQAYSTYTAASFGADGKISSCLIDASQTNVNFDKTGKITSDIKAEQKTKNELGDAYGMKKASSIGMEWNQQADNYAKYVVGKTLDEVKGIAVNEEGAPSDAELAASVTVGIDGFNAVLEIAAAKAK